MMSATDQDGMEREAEAVRAALGRFSAEAQLDALLGHLAKMLAAVRDDEAPAVAVLLCKWLEETGAGAPDHDGFGAIRDDAAFWAGIATPRELEAYVGAGLRQMGRTHFAAAARKRILVTLWESLGDGDRRRFLAKVDPAGRFRGAA